MAVCSSATGSAIFAAVLRQFLCSRHFMPRFNLSVSERKHTMQSITADIIISDSALPIAAPVTPKSAPGMKIFIPAAEIFLPGNISRKLNIISNKHIRAFNMLGVFMSPLLWSILPESCLICTKGNAAEYIKNILKHRFVYLYCRPAMQADDCLLKYLPRPV